MKEINYDELTLGGAWQEINIAALAYNIKQVIESAPGVLVVAVVKADAYGHGMERAATVFHENGAHTLAVANIREALRLRKALPTADVWAMGATTPDLTQLAVENDIILTIHTHDDIANFSNIHNPNQIIRAHIKVDTGFHRLGFTLDEFGACLSSIQTNKSIKIEGIFTHLALLDEEHDMAQFALFDKVREEAARRGVRDALFHAADGISLYRYPHNRYDMARVGSLLYGCATRETPFTPKLAGSVKARIVALRVVRKGEGVGYDEEFRAERDMLVATLPIGYADGILRNMRGKGEASVNGVRAKYVGLPCMDQMMIDVSDAPNTKIGDIVTLLGGDVSIDQFAAWQGSNRNEPLSLLGRRLPRLYHEDGVLR